jgi:hypothetical protein
MPQRILSSLTWKAGVAVAATALAAGTGATTVHLVSDSHAADHPAADVSEHVTTTTTTTSTTVDDGSSTEDESDDVEAKTVTDDASTEHPDNFGAVVSEDAHDGGVDGQEISDMAHERNDARKAGAEHATADDHPSGDDHADEADDAGEDHRSDQGDEKGQDDSHPADDTDD